jgi:hypothetical protein
VLKLEDVVIMVLSCVNTVGIYLKKEKHAIIVHHASRQERGKVIHLSIERESGHHVVAA